MLKIMRQVCRMWKGKKWLPTSVIYLFLNTLSFKFPLIMSSARRGCLINRNSSKFMRECPAFNLRNFERSLSNKLFPYHTPQINFTPKKYIHDKFEKIIKFYEEFSGLKELRLAQEKVDEAGTKLSIIQEERRMNFSNLLEIQNKLKSVYCQLENVKRGDYRYIPLITEEHELLKQEELQQEKFKQIDRAERDQFTFYTDAVRNSHEKERAQAQKTKYWSIIGSVIGGIAGYFASTVSSYKKNSELKKLIADTSNSNLEIKLNSFLENYKKIAPVSNNVDDKIIVKDKVLNDLINNNTDSDNSKAHKYLNELLYKTFFILTSLDETTKLLDRISGFGVYKLKFDDDDNKTDLLLMNLESLCLENQKLTGYLGIVIICLVVSTIIRIAT